MNVYTAARPHFTVALSLAIISLLCIALAAGPSYNIIVNGQVLVRKAVTVNGEVYVPLSAVKLAGLGTAVNGNTLTLGNSNGASPAVAGGANQHPALEGCMNETLFNGLWRLRVLKVEPIHKDDAPLAPGWGVTVEVRNGWTGTLNPGNSGFANDNMFIVEPGGNSLAVDAYNEQPLVGHDFPQGGMFTYQLVFYYPYGTTAEQVHAPQKFLMGADPKKIDGSLAAAGVHYSTPAPSFRVNLDCKK
jgi:hypothetical protein